MTQSEMNIVANKVRSQLWREIRKEFETIRDEIGVFTDVFVTIEEASDIVKVPVDKLRVIAKKLGAEKPGKSWIFSRNRLKQCLLHGIVEEELRKAGLKK